MFVLLIASVLLHPQWCNLCLLMSQGSWQTYKITDSGKFSGDFHRTDLFTIAVKGGRAHTDLTDLHQVKIRLDKVSYRISWLFSMSLPDKLIHALRIYSSYQEDWVINNLPVSARQIFHKTYDGELEISYLLRRDLGIAMITWMYITWQTLCFMGSHSNRATPWPYLLSTAFELF